MANQVELSDDLPLIIEIAASTERVEDALPDLISLASAHSAIALTSARLWAPEPPATPSSDQE